jgi:hypothetical protein
LIFIVIAVSMSLWSGLVRYGKYFQEGEGYFIMFVVMK